MTVTPIAVWREPRANQPRLVLIDRKLFSEAIWEMARILLVLSDLFHWRRKIVGVVRVTQISDRGQSERHFAMVEAAGARRRGRPSDLISKVCLRMMPLELTSRYGSR